MTKFQIQRNVVTSYVYEWPVEKAVAEQFAGPAVEGKLPGGGTFKLDLWPAGMKPGAPVKLQLVVTTQETEERGDAPSAE
jgi:hypothetical protein